MDLKKKIKKTLSLNINIPPRKDSLMNSKMIKFKKPMRQTSYEATFNAPPVFPKTCSLFDSHYHGGAYLDQNLDKELLLAIKTRTSNNDSLISTSDNEPISPSGSLYSTTSAISNDSAFEVESNKSDSDKQCNNITTKDEKKLGIIKGTMSFYGEKIRPIDKLTLRNGRRNTVSELQSISSYNPKEWGMKPLKKKGTFKKSLQRLRALSLGNAFEKGKLKSGKELNF
uniref:Uncharacterized protein n=1 Tax=Parastrongyloides trichosuri TaxID=131310 RepID=A0A0N4ZSS6_PARTI